MLKKVADSCQCNDLVAQDWGILLVDPDTFLWSSDINPCHTIFLYCSVLQGFSVSLQIYRCMLLIISSTKISHFLKGAANISEDLRHALRCFLTVKPSCFKPLRKPSTSLETSGKVHSSTSSELMAYACRERVCICVHGALQKHIVKISGQEGLYCVTEAECSSYSPAAGTGAWGWHQHKDKNVMWGISTASFKASPQDTLYTWTLPLFQQHLIIGMWPTDDPSTHGLVR